MIQIRSLISFYLFLFALMLFETSLIGAIALAIVAVFFIPRESGIRKVKMDGGKSTLV